jgi:LacI family fructose operon transcriptional repressor
LVPEPIVLLRTACERGDSAGEQVVQFANGVSTAPLGHCVGCFDWDPFAAQLPFTLVMMRQNAETMVEEAFASLLRQSTPNAA